ncbi:MAG: ABC transporter substrate-binding protein [Acidimicrobiales bacterium]
MTRDESGGISRRHFLELAGGMAGLGLVAAACGSGHPSTPGTSSGGGGGGGGTTTSTTSQSPATTLLEPSAKLSGSLKILQWSHFVPAYDKWFDPFAKAWGQHVGVNVSVDHIASTDVVPRTASEFSAGTGHDLIEWLLPPAQLEPGVVDLSDVNHEAISRFGSQQPFCKASSYDPTTGKYYGYTHSWVPDPGDYRKSLWQKAGMGSGPVTFNDLLNGGKSIKANQSVPMGIGMSNEIDSNMAARAMIWSFGGSVQDKNEKVVLNSTETIDAVDYMVKLYKQTMTTRCSPGTPRPTTRASSPVSSRTS